MPSLVSSIGAARRNAREERNNITVDVWESLNGLWLELTERLRGTRARLDRSAPHTGRDTHRILREFAGYDDDRIAALTQAGVLR